MAIDGPERIFDIAIISKIPVMFASVMYAPKTPAGIPELVEYYKKDLIQLRLIARNAAMPCGRLIITYEKVPVLRKQERPGKS
jgi:hypothetical protein